MNERANELRELIALEMECAVLYVSMGLEQERDLSLARIDRLERELREIRASDKGTV